MIAVVIPGTLLLLAVFWIVGAYNRLVRLRKRLRRAFAQLDVQFKRRHAIVPGLVESVRHSLAYERGALDAVIDAHNAAVAANAQAALDPASEARIRQMGSTEISLGVSLARMFALAEASPDLKTSQQMHQLATELDETEAGIVFARQAYNDDALRYNGALQQFPSSVIANMFGFGLAEPVAAPDAVLPQNTIAARSA